MHSLGHAKLSHFKYASISLRFLLEKMIFRAFYTLSWKAPLFTFGCWSIDEKFFFIDVDVIPGGMHWKTMASKEKVKDVGPTKAEYQENALFKALTTHSSKCTVIPEGALVLVGMSLC
ncbi:hypothetical protein Hanom_Chr02g00154161 [Helianthus anomalus]